MEPLEQGLGITLGNPLRRVLLRSIEGAAVTWMRVEGVLHEFSAIPHVKEEVLELMQNVKAIRLRPLSDRPGRMRLEVTGPGTVSAGDIVASADFEIVNPELHLATLDSPEGKLVMEFNVEHGKGYVPAQHGNGLPVGTLPVDAIFTPVRKVNYSVERIRVGQVTDFERLVLEVWSDGTIAPTAALQKAAQLLADHFFRFTQAEKVVEGAPHKPAVVLTVPAEVYNLPVERLELSSRTLNCLKRAGINKVGEILERTQEDLKKIRNFGDKSLEELLNRMREKDLPLPETRQPAPEPETETKAPELVQIQDDTSEESGGFPEQE
ncbi:MAG: DNA-directed RNA polymerase subunit alpha [Chloroflexi bacterium]|nr:DNA-directed RNA polymerase subunit alpha [Chloroflexota bacterium]